MERALEANEQAALTKILAVDFEGVEKLRAQLPHVRVVGGPPTLLDLVVDPSAAEPAPVASGVLPVRAFVNANGDDIDGELLVWVNDGYLDGLEHAWVTDDVPDGIPPPEALSIETR